MATSTVSPPLSEARPVRLGVKVHFVMHDIDVENINI